MQKTEQRYPLVEALMCQQQGEDGLGHDMVLLATRHSRMIRCRPQPAQQFATPTSKASVLSI